MKNRIVRWALVPATAICVFSAWQPCDATLAEGMRTLVGFTVGAVAQVSDAARDERTGVTRVQLSNGMIFAMRCGPDELIDSGSGDAIICFRQVLMNVEHRLVIEDSVYIAQRLQ